MKKERKNKRVRPIKADIAAAKREKEKDFIIKICAVVGLVFIILIGAQSVRADEIVHKFKSPSFSGINTSSHYLTIENQEFSRKTAILEKKAAAERQRIRDEANTNLSKFMKNVESRIYAQLSKQLVDSMFGEDASTSGTVTFEGTTISYVKSSETVDLTIVDANGSTTVITVPVGDFTF